ncbi:hypothetical protein OU995_21590 [Roseateles sp. SL47]|uniref:hypothetical protein n=1 Tax=Roseateles sp. SL47 TaxID=2995138 RepID=UPI00226F5096|nr:hypothetical protein [Roseateles sp. SL47]WAC72130.1 hypothetical protein OU995_21590 [Roseateles sp. SL47]
MVHEREGQTLMPAIPKGKKPEQLADDVRLHVRVTAKALAHAFKEDFLLATELTTLLLAGSGGG